MGDFKRSFIIKKSKGILLYLFVLWSGSGCDAVLLGENEGTISLEDNLRIPDQLSDGLETSSPETEDLDPEKIRSLVTYLNEDRSGNHRSLLIARNNKLVLEAYFNGWNRERKQDLRSATKSFTSALVGIAIDKKILLGVDQPVFEFFEEYGSFQNWDPLKAQITIKDFLRMRTGLLCNDWLLSSPGNEEHMYETRDWVKFILDLPTSGPPGENFYYCTGAPVTLGAIVSNASGEKIPDFSAEHLFGPLGISEYSWEHMPNGRTDTGGHLHLRPRDLLKFGLLFLNQGSWNGQQLISSGWVDESTRPNGVIPNLRPGGPELYYGYLWWIRTGSVPVYFANGNGGQLLFVIPSQNAVVVFTGGYYNSDYLSRFLGILDGRILPAFQ